LVNSCKESKNKRQEQALLTRDNLYTSALQLIREKGFENVLIEDITSAAGVAKGTFYKHFHSKENLLLFTLEKSDLFYLGAFSNTKSIEKFDDRLGEFIYIAYQEVEKLGKEVLRALCINLYTEESKTLFFNKDRELYKCLTELIEYGKKTGYLSSTIQAEYYVEKIVVLLLGIESYWCMNSGESNLASFARENVFTLLRGLAE
jgi:AcrR family transcriptional regulator